MTAAERAAHQVVRARHTVDRLRATLDAIEIDLRDDKPHASNAAHALLESAGALVTELAMLDAYLLVAEGSDAPEVSGE